MNIVEPFDEDCLDGAKSSATRCAFSTSIPCPVQPFSLIFGR